MLYRSHTAKRNHVGMMVHSTMKFCFWAFLHMQSSYLPADTCDEMKPLTFTQEHLEKQVGTPWRQSLMWATRPYSPCTIAFAGIKVWAIAVPTYMVLIVDLNDFMLSHHFFNIVPCEDYLGVYALHKHDTIGGKPVSNCGYHIFLQCTISVLNCAIHYVMWHT